MWLKRWSPERRRARFIWVIDQSIKPVLCNGHIFIKKCTVCTIFFIIRTDVITLCYDNCALSGSTGHSIKELCFLSCSTAWRCFIYTPALQWMETSWWRILTRALPLFLLSLSSLFLALSFFHADCCERVFSFLFVCVCVCVCWSVECCGFCCCSCKDLMW